MSDETYAALRAAVDAHVADECNGAALIDWVLVTAELGFDDVREGTVGHYLVMDQDSYGYRAEGLLRVGLEFTRDSVSEDE
jgi:hypothetical protein